MTCKFSSFKHSTKKSESKFLHRNVKWLIASYKNTELQFFHHGWHNQLLVFKGNYFCTQSYEGLHISSLKK